MRRRRREPRRRSFVELGEVSRGEEERNIETLTIRQQDAGVGKKKQGTMLAFVTGVDSIENLLNRCRGWMSCKGTTAISFA